MGKVHRSACLVSLVLVLGEKLVGIIGCAIHL